MTKKEILKEIQEQQVYANENIDEGPRETMAGRVGRKNQAIESLKRLRKQYAMSLQQTAAFVVVIGDKREEFTALAKDKFKWFNTDPETFFTTLVDKIPQDLYLGRESMPNIFDILGRYLEDKMIELDSVTGYPQLMFRQEYQQTVKTRGEFLALVKRAITKQIGGEIVGIQAINSLTDEAIKREHSVKFAPIVLSSGDETFALTVANDLERISNRVFLVKAGEVLTTGGEFDITLDEVSEDTVKKALKVINNQLTKGE